MVFNIEITIYHHSLAQSFFENAWAGTWYEFWKLPWSKIANKGTANNVNKIQSIRPSSVFLLVILDRSSNRRWLLTKPVISDHFLGDNMTITNSGRHWSHKQKWIIKSPIAHVTIFAKFRICSNTEKDFKQIILELVQF